jgi:signal peptidase I
MKRLLGRIFVAVLLGTGAAIYSARRKRSDPLPVPAPENVVETEAVPVADRDEPTVVSASPSPRRGAGAARWGGRVVGWAAVGAGTALVLSVLVPYAFGMRSYTVMSGSMEPAIDTGDVVVERTVDPQTIRPGDIVSFRDPTRHNHLITHRVRRVAISDGSVHVITRGDANTGVERWSVPIHGRLGLVVYRLPHVGYLAHAIGSTPGRLGFIVLPVLLIGATLLIDLWRPKRPREETDDDVDPLLTPEPVLA